MAYQKLSADKSAPLGDLGRCPFCGVPRSEKRHTLTLEEELRLNEERYRAGRR
jgi:hypothetical protein